MVGAETKEGEFMTNLEQYLMSRKLCNVWHYFITNKPQYTCPIFYECLLKEAFECRTDRCYRHFSEWARREAVTEIPDEDAVKILQKQYPKGLFKTRIKDTYYGINNTGAIPLVQEFESLPECDSWLSKISRPRKETEEINNG